MVINTPIFIRNSNPSPGSLAGSLVINNARLTNVPIAVGVANPNTVVLAGGASKTIASWGQGNVYRGSNLQGQFVQGDLPNAPKASSLLNADGTVVGRVHPQYENYRVSDFVSVRDLGAKGDGRMDDTAVLQDILNRVRSGLPLDIFMIDGTLLVRWMQDHFL